MEEMKCASCGAQKRLPTLDQDTLKQVQGEKEFAFVKCSSCSENVCNSCAIPREETSAPSLRESLGSILSSASTSLLSLGSGPGSVMGSEADNTNATRMVCKTCAKVEMFELSSQKF